MTWSVSYITKDTIAVAISNSTLHNRLHIINVYNEIATNALQDLRETVSRLDSRDEALLLGDFNLYHPLWSTVQRRAMDTVPAA
jgi:hypothetical protein